MNLNATQTARRGKKLLQAKPPRSVCNAVMVVEMFSACLEIYPLDKTLQWQEIAETRTGFMLADNVNIISNTLLFRVLACKPELRVTMSVYMSFTEKAL